MSSLTSELLLAETPELYIDPARVSLSREDNMLGADSRQRQRDALDSGVLPSMLGDYSFVWDQRPTGEEDQKIPDHDFTAYWANHQIPVAPSGTDMHDHDAGHVGSYQELCGNRDFPTVAHQASTNALGDPELERQFTTAMDRFSDEHRNFIDDRAGLRYSDDWYGRQSIVAGARLRLQELIRLANKLPEDEALPEASQTVFDRMWQNLGFKAFENQLSGVPIHLRTHGQMESFYSRPSSSNHVRFLFKIV